MNRMGIIDLTNLSSNSSVSTSEYVIINSDINSGRRAASFNLANEGGFLEHIGDGFYKCKRTVANNLSLAIISDYPIILK